MKRTLTYRRPPVLHVFSQIKLTLGKKNKSFFTYIFIVPFGPKFVLSTSWSPLAAVILRCNAAADLATSAFGLSALTAAMLIVKPRLAQPRSQAVRWETLGTRLRLANKSNGLMDCGSKSNLISRVPRAPRKTLGTGLCGERDWEEYRPFPSSLVPLFQNESKCETEFCMQVHFHANQSHFHKNGFALRLALKQRHKRTRKWPIKSSG